MLKYGRLVSLARNAEGLTAEKLVVLIYKKTQRKVSSTFISVIETGKKLPSMELFVVLSKVLKMNHDDALASYKKEKLDMLKKRYEDRLMKGVEKYYAANSKANPITTKKS